MAYRMAAKGFLKALRAAWTGFSQYGRGPGPDEQRLSEGQRGATARGQRTIRLARAGRETVIVQLEEADGTIQEWIAELGHVPKTTVWVINRGTTTLYRLGRALWPDHPQPQIMANEELNRTLLME